MGYIMIKPSWKKVVHFTAPKIADCFDDVSLYFGPEGIAYLIGELAPEPSIKYHLIMHRFLADGCFYFSFDSVLDPEFLRIHEAIKHIPNSTDVMSWLYETMSKLRS